MPIRRSGSRPHARPGFAGPRERTAAIWACSHGWRTTLTRAFARSPGADQTSTSHAIGADVLETLAKGFKAARQRLTGKAELDDDTIEEALRDVRLSLLEGDVEFRVVK